MERRRRDTILQKALPLFFCLRDVEICVFFIDGGHVCFVLLFRSDLFMNIAAFSVV